jgi:hypothetical protein
VGTVVEAQVHPWRIIVSPDLYDVQLMQKADKIVSESEMLVIGPITGTAKPINIGKR